MARAGDVVYVMPSELGPFYRHLLREFDVRRVEQLPCDAVRGSSVNVLDVNSWKSSIVHEITSSGPCSGGKALRPTWSA